MTLPHTLPPLKYNSIIDADSYKVPHWMFYRPGIKRVYSFLESRGGENDEIMLAGLQPTLYKLSQPVQDWEMEEANKFFTDHFGFPSYYNKKMWDEIVNKHDRLLPLRIKALPEGLLVPKRTPLLTVENTGSLVTMPLTSYKETMLLRNTWGPSSIASRVFRMKRKVKHYFDLTSDNPVSPFAVLDFCSRGVFGDSHSELAGAAFCFMFQGSDNMPGIRFTNYYYDHPMAAFSVAATEHSIASGWVRDDAGYITNSLDKATPKAILSLVGDTWNIFDFAKELSCQKNRDKIGNKELLIVVRPDSGERHDVMPAVLRTLADNFGTTINSKGFNVINHGVKVLWADGMNETTVIEPFQIAHNMKIAADSVMTGAGGGIANADLDRDTDRWAFKASDYEMEDGSHLEVFKDPITDPGKTSKKGRFSVGYKTDGGYITGAQGTVTGDDLLMTRFLNGAVAAPENLETIRARIDAQL